MNQEDTGKERSQRRDVLVLDFGGVLAEEGFRLGLSAIARRNGIQEEAFVQRGYEAVHGTGYVTGKGREADFWDELRKHEGIKGTDEELRDEILSRFVLRDWMLDLIGRLKDRGVIIALLTDQTDWLYELDRRRGFLGEFQFVFNSFNMGLSKRDPLLFKAVLAIMGRGAGDVVFVDDDPGNILRAGQAGLHTILYRGTDDFLAQLSKHFSLEP